MSLILVVLKELKDSPTMQQLLKALNEEKNEKRAPGRHSLSIRIFHGLAYLAKRNQLLENF